MNAIRFVLGFVSAFFDEFNLIATRDRIHDLVRPNGRTSDGFDFAYGYIIFRRRHWRTFFREQKIRHGR